MMETDIKNKCWLPIKGFPDYRINRKTKRVESKKSGKWSEVGKNSKTVHLLRKENGRSRDYNWTHGRILFAATFGYDPSQIPSDVFIDKNGQLTTTKEIACNSHKRMRNVDLYYREAVRFSKEVLAAYKSNDYCKVIENLASHERYVKKYINNSLNLYGQDAVNELWHNTLEETINTIKKKNSVVFCPRRYLVRVAKAMHSREAKRKRLITSYESYIYKI